MFAFGAVSVELPCHHTQQLVKSLRTPATTNTKYQNTCNTGQTRNKLLEQLRRWLVLRERRGGLDHAAGTWSRAMCVPRC